VLYQLALSLPRLPRPDFAHWIESVSGPWVYVLAAVLTAAETGTMLFFIPGEITLIVAGIAASTGKVNVWALVAVACVSAIVGDGIGFTIGKKWGPRLKTSRLGSKLGASSWQRSEDLIRKRKGLIVLIGRWIGFLRAVMPASAGMSGMNYRRDFLPYDVVGACSWATLCVLGGWKLGEQAENIVKYIGWFAAAAAVVIAVVYFGKKKLTKLA
jgi:membrane-associated protein